MSPVAGNTDEMYSLGPTAFRLGLLRRTRRHPLQHPPSADVFVDVGPMHAFAGPDYLEMATLRRRRIRQPPRPRQGNTDNAPIGQFGHKSVFGNFECDDTRFTIRRSVHPMPLEDGPNGRELFCECGSTPSLKIHCCRPGRQVQARICRPPDLGAHERASARCNRSCKRKTDTDQRYRKPLARRIPPIDAPVEGS